MASDAMGDVIKIGALGVGAWLLWSWYSSSVAAAPVSTGGTPAAGTPPAGTPSVVTPPAVVTPPPVAPAATLSIPSGFTVTPDINNSLKGTVTVNGSPVTLNVISGSSSSATSGVVYNSAGADVTSMFTPSQLQQLIVAFSLAPQGSTSTSSTSSAQAAFAVLLQNCLAAAGTNPTALAACETQYGPGAATGVAGLGQYARRANYVPAGSSMVLPRNYVWRAF